MRFAGPRMLLRHPESSSGRLQETGRLHDGPLTRAPRARLLDDPVLGVPSLARNRSIPREGFTFDARVTVARGFVVAAGGSAGQVEAADGTTYRFSSREPAPFLNLCITRFRTLEGNRFILSYLPADEAGAKKIFRRAEQALALLTTWFGPPPSAPRLAVIEIPRCAASASRGN